ncbi:MAG: hypothetical protein IKV31_02435 [Paludibacteraceae bacterium]|nr:hypothetical protein [Paludibacteraceae bacterium]
MKNSLLVFIGLLLVNSVAIAQDWDWWPLGLTHENMTGDSLYYRAEVIGVVSSGTYAPFWLQSNQNGNISASPYSGNLSVGVYKPAQQDQRWYDYDFAVQMTGRLQSNTPIIWKPFNQTTTGYFNQLYAHIRLYFIDFTAGIKPLVYESIDNSLSSGSMIISGNSQPLPRLSIGIDKYTAFPGTYGYLELKGGITHAWMTDNAYIENYKLHHKYIGLRLGGQLPINLSYEFHHAAQWGGTSPTHGDLTGGSTWRSFINAFLARSGGNTTNEQLNAQGNHLVSQQLALTAKGQGWNITAYWQNLSEDNLVFLGFGHNLPDGIFGISMQQNHWPYIQGITYEYMNSTDQSGPWHDRDGLCFGADDRYYQNLIYQNGWNYFYRTIGTPFITSPLYNTDGTIHTLNSRVRLHHLGIRGDIYGFKYRLLCSYAQNFGNDNTSKLRLSTNWATLLEVSKHVEQAWGLDFGVSIASDLGTQFGNQIGAMFTIRKQGLITQW